MADGGGQSMSEEGRAEVVRARDAEFRSKLDGENIVLLSRIFFFVFFSFPSADGGSDVGRLERRRNVMGQCKSCGERNVASGMSGKRERVKRLHFSHVFIAVCMKEFLMDSLVVCRGALVRESADTAGFPSTMCE